MNWANQKVFVTGGNGFLGSWLVQRLVRLRAQVTCLICEQLPNSLFSLEQLEQQVRVVPGRLEDRALLRQVLAEGFDVVFHLGAQAIVGVANRDPLPTFETNILGTWNLLEACRLDRRAQAIVVASSDKAYGDSPDLPYRESHPLRGSHPYDVSKSCADLIASTYHDTYGLPVGITRCGNIIGGGDLNWNRIVPGTIRSLLRGERPIVRSDGRFIRDYIYVEDIVEAYLLIAAALGAGQHHGQSWNVSDSRPIDVLGIVDLLRQACGRLDLLPDVRNEATHEIRDQHLDSTKIRVTLGWQPGHSLEQALHKSVAWYRAHAQ